MVENLIVGVVCLVLGGIGGKATKWIDKRGNEDETAKAAIIKLTASVDHIASELTAIRTDMREDRRELFGRLGTAEQRIAKLEATSSLHHGS